MGWITLGLSILLQAPSRAQALHDARHDFDFQIGTWKSHVKRLLHPLIGSNAWTYYDGITIVLPVWKGRANLQELEADGPAGHIENLSLRLFNPATRQWSLNYASGKGGTINAPPTIGSFKNGRGMFYDRETINGKDVLVRNLITRPTPNVCRFEQAFSTDNGRTWEANWIAVDTRIKTNGDF